ncbi:MAG: NAD(P)H-dependent oxidoreductase [Chitinophagales bacterium]|nr:NAD(P)H-dependent oxidoreductase [Chitinophagales bacterium]
MLNITILYGAIREGRLSIRAAKALLNALNNSGKVNATLIDIKDHNLPVMESRLKDMDNPPPALVTISEKLSSADGIVFVTPEYNNSYSGALKNAVDYFTKEWAKKPIGIVCGSNGRMGGVNASNLLQLLVLAIGAFPMPYKLLVPELHNSLNEEGEPLTDIMAKNLNRFVEEYIWFVEAISTQNKKKQ